MSNKSNDVKSIQTWLRLLAVATILSIILYYVIAFVGIEIIFIILFPVDISIPFPYNLCGLLVSVLGFMLIIWANYTLLFIGKIGLEAREPFHTPSTLVVEGPYKFTRNPIYLSVVIIFFGLAILLGSLTLFIIAIALFIIFWTWFISWEEKRLEEEFGEEYLEYKGRVRRWL